MKPQTIAAAWLGGILLAAASSSVFAGPKEDVDAMEDRRYDTMIAKDAAAMAQTLADEFIYHQPSGKVQDKAGYVAQITGPDVKLQRAQRYDVKIHVYGDVATVTGSTYVDAVMGGKEAKLDLRYLNVWVLRDGRWQLAARQSSFKTPPK